jgi:hypothetical protein
LHVSQHNSKIKTGSLNTFAVNLVTVGTAQLSCVLGKEIQRMTHTLVKEVTKAYKISFTISTSYMGMQKIRLVVLPKILYSTEIKIKLMDGIEPCFR